MAESTEIEKKSLEAHVELCAERYTSLDIRLDNLDEKVTKVDEVVEQIYAMIHTIGQKNTDRLIAWGVGIISILVSVVGWLLAHYVLKQ